ncbi:hypothetical protein N7493_011135 [Penicillium malachiteum]|uniref:Uncharacterized protein n=1 Tax=Penicillium malachiteum TaxID=1324776 RepID=A0AAD6HBJ0_9EURO|nr:hypothetical protein N7493_011135 [Penicillium malachiteum]
MLISRPGEIFREAEWIVTFTRYGNSDVMSQFFGKESEKISITEDMMVAACQNEFYSESIMQVFYTYQRHLVITHQVLTAITNNRRGSKILQWLLRELNVVIQVAPDDVPSAIFDLKKDSSVLELFLDHVSDSQISDEIIEASADCGFVSSSFLLLLRRKPGHLNFPDYVIEAFLLSHPNGVRKEIDLILDGQSSDFSVSEQTLEAAARAGQFRAKAIITTCLTRMGDRLPITEEIVITLLHDKRFDRYHQEGDENLVRLLLERHSESFPLTQDVLVAAKNAGAFYLMSLLIKRGSDIQITTKVITAAMKSQKTLKFLFDHCESQMTITEDLLHIAARVFEFDTGAMEMLLGSFDGASRGTDLFRLMIGNADHEGRSSHLFERLLDKISKDAQVYENLLLIVARSHRKNQAELMQLLLHEIGDNAPITTEVFVAAADSRAGHDMMNLILGHVKDGIPIEEEVMRTAAGNPCGKTIVELLLNRPGTLEHIKEEVFFAAAGNSDG